MQRNQVVFLTILFYLLVHRTQLLGQCTKLDYLPHGKIICFKFDSLAIYTDTSSVFSIIDKYEDSSYRVRSRMLIMNELNSRDTLFFSGHFIPFRDTVTYPKQDSWFVDYVVMRLTDANRVVIIDQMNMPVARIKRKKVKWKREGYGMVKGTKINYVNCDNGEVLFSEFVSGVIIDPTW